MIYFLDTSAILNGALDEFPDGTVSPIVLKELEDIKNSPHRDENIKFLAREAIRKILHSTKIHYSCFSQQELDRMLKKIHFLSPINDHYLLCEALLNKKKSRDAVRFITSDSALYLFLLYIKDLIPLYYEPKKVEQPKENEYCGWKICQAKDNELNTLYSNPKDNVFNCLTNEFVKIYNKDKLVDVQFWTGERYRNITYKDIKNKFLDETISPRNLEQKMAFDLLQNPKIKVKLLSSAWGGGKTLIALSYALEKVHSGEYQKLVFVRNNIIVADTNDIGYLPGNIDEKMSIWGAPLADHLGGQMMLDKLIEDGVIEIYPLSHMRGRSLKSSIVLCDECENMNDKLVTFLLSRIEEDSEIIFCGDVAQIDNKKFEKNNGIKAMLDNLAGDPLFGTVKLIKSERGPVGRMCDKIIPPR